MDKRGRAITIFGLIATLGFPCLPVTKWEKEFASIGHLVGYEIIWWSFVAATLAYVHFVERRPLASLGFHRLGVKDLPIAVGAAVVMLGGLGAIYFLLFPALHVNEGHQMNQLIHTPLWWRIVSVIRAGVSEEILFRGYAIDRAQELTGSKAAAAALSIAVFALAHVGSWGWPHLLIAGFGGAVLTMLFLWRRNLWINIVTHCIVDGVAILTGS